jgi:hypothetical protein
MLLTSMTLRVLHLHTWLPMQNELSGVQLKHAAFELDFVQATWTPSQNLILCVPRLLFCALVREIVLGETRTQTARVAK